MGYTRSVNLIIRKCAEQQAQLTPFENAIRIFRNRSPLIWPMTFLLCLFSSFAEADIYRFVTIDGIETFTDAPSNRSATVVIKERPAPTTKKSKSVKKQKTHDISLDEIIQKAVTASLNPNEEKPYSFEPHLP